MRFINVRLQHVFGPGDDPDKFVPSLVKSCLGDLPEIRLTDGTQKRDFVFILDVVSAYSRILACLGKMPTGYVELDVGRGVLFGAEFRGFAAEGGRDYGFSRRHVPLA